MLKFRSLVVRSGGGSGLLWLLGFGAIGAAGIWWARRQSRKALAQRTLAVRRTVDEDVTQFGEEVVREVQRTVLENVHLRAAEEAEVRGELLI